MSDYSYIINGVKPVALESNSTVLARLLANQNAMQANEENSMKLAAMRQGVADDQTMRANTTQAAGDMSRLQQLAYGSGNYKGGAEVGRNVLTNQKTQTENEKAQIENQFKKLDLAAQLMQGVVDQGSYDRIKPEVLKFFGPEAAAKLPQVYDPQTIAENQAKSLSAKESMQLRLQELTQNETRANNLRTDSRARDAQGVTLRGQDLTDRRARDAQGIAIRGQDMADARGRELNATRVEENRLKREQKQLTSLTAKQTDAADTLMLLDEVDKLLPKATGSFLGAGVDAAAAVFGSSTPGAKVSAQLKALQGALVSKMPKMSGPQSDKDVLLYREMAGQIGDSTIPAATRQAAASTVRKLNEKYAASTNEGALAPQSQPPASTANPGALEAEMRRRGLLK